MKISAAQCALWLGKNFYVVYVCHSNGTSDKQKQSHKHNRIQTSEHNTVNQITSDAVISDFCCSKKENKTKVQ